MARAITPKNPNGAHIVGVRRANIVAAVADHHRFVRVEPLGSEQASKELGLVIESAGEIGAVDSNKMGREAEVLDNTAREDFGLGRA